MHELHEPVSVVTPTGERPGTLGIDPTDGLPILHLRKQHIMTPPHPLYDVYRPWSFPASWIIVDASDERVEGPLLDAWRDVDRIRQAVKMAQREAEQEGTR